MTPLAKKLARRITKSGPIGLDAYMQTCLADPEYGYYTGSARPAGGPIGRDGDFTTAPEISQMFGELIGAWCADYWQTHCQNVPLHIIELGPGRGTLMADIERTVGRAIAGLDIHLVETSGELRKTQAKALHGCTPEWHDNLSTLPDGPAIFIANEFFDALPVRQFERGPSLWRERLVDYDNATNKFTFCLGPEAQQDALSDPRFAKFRSGDIAEVNAPSKAIASQIGQRIGRDGGAALFIDYGYRSKPGTIATGDTFQAITGHSYVDPLAEPGTADLTAHVDFSALAVAARHGAAALDVWGPIGQGDFLKRLGIESRAETLCRHAAPAEIATALNRLTSARQMGSLFKVLALCGANGKDSARENMTPAGFSEEDRFAWY